ncbi:hypothetical protein [Sandaracinobacter neustonicus]|nr:hypothetical protein [Sandaracinobacter neustonicus]
MSGVMSNGKILLIAITLGFLGGFSVVAVANNVGSQQVHASAD